MYNFHITKVVNMSTPRRRPQKPKIRNFVAKHAKEVARTGAGPHKDPRLDYTRHPRNKPARATHYIDDEDFDFDSDEELDTDLPDVPEVEQNFSRRVSRP